MTEAHDYFIELGLSLPESVKGQLFGKPCFKIKGKAFVCFFEDEMVFKLSGEAHSEAISLDGSQLFDPSKKKRAMKEWVQVSFEYKDRWASLLTEAYDYVKGK